MNSSTDKENVEDDDLDEISLSSKDPEDFTPQAPGSDFVGPDAYGDRPSDYLGWTSESNRRKKVMKISRKQLRTILNEEAKKYLFEDCGCGGGHPAIAHVDDMPYGSANMEDSSEDILSGALSKEEALSLVGIIAARTSCPVTQKALMGVVSDLSGEGVEDYDIASDEAFGTGYSTGETERDAFSYTGDLPDDPEDALGLGYQVGLMGLA